SGDRLGRSRTRVVPVLRRAGVLPVAVRGVRHRSTGVHDAGVDRRSDSCDRRCPRAGAGRPDGVLEGWLQLPCSSGACTVTADWYFPAGSNPQGLIYFQHGALANSAMYSYTAATLAEETNSIV